MGSLPQEIYAQAYEADSGVCSPRPDLKIANFPATATLYSSGEVVYFFNLLYLTFVVHVHDENYIVTIIKCQIFHHSRRFAIECLTFLFVFSFLFHFPFRITNKRQHSINTWIVC